MSAWSTAQSYIHDMANQWKKHTQHYLPVQFIAAHPHKPSKTDERLLEATTVFEMVSKHCQNNRFVGPMISPPWPSTCSVLCGVRLTNKLVDTSEDTTTTDESRLFGTSVTPGVCMCSQLYTGAFANIQLTPGYFECQLNRTTLSSTVLRRLRNAALERPGYEAKNGRRKRAHLVGGVVIVGIAIAAYFYRDYIAGLLPKVLPNWKKSNKY